MSRRKPSPPRRIAAATTAITGTPELVAQGRRKTDFDSWVAHQMISANEAAALCLAQELAATTAGQLVTSGLGERVDSSLSVGSYQRAHLERMTNGKLLAALYGHCGQRASRVVQGIIQDPVHGMWRTTVEQITGEKNEVAQAACVRFSARSLLEAITAMGGTMNADGEIKFTHRS